MGEDDKGNKENRKRPVMGERNATTYGIYKILQS
jgi:hypothetical protein